MRAASLLALALLPVAACGGGDDDGSPTEDAATIDAAPAAPDADETPDAPQANCTPVRGANVAIEPVATFDGMGDTAPLLATSPPGDPRLFVIMQRGRIGIVENGERVPGHFLDISGKVQGGNTEQGLLGLAFHPQYRSNRKFYVYYTANRLPDDPDGDGDGDVEPFRQVVAEYTTSATDANKADPASGRELLSIPDPLSNHNGGMIEFGPDGRLWISVGDGGEQGDPKGLAQSDAWLLGKMLRLDVDTPGAAPEIWARGLRNPWRWSFDRMTNELYIGDVGQSEYEEINVVPASPGGLNFGWALFEGEEARIRGSDPTGKVFPVVIHTQGNEHLDGDGEWEAIIGGQVYRGACFPDLQGMYFYTDNNVAELWAFRWQGGAAQGDARVLENSAFVDGPTSLHADAFGELYVTDQGGGVSRIVARP